MTTTKVLTFAFAMFALIGLVGISPASAHEDDAGCTPGYWKANAKKNGGDRWPDFVSTGTITPSTLLTDEVDNGLPGGPHKIVNTNGLDITNMTYLQALQLQGGPGLEGKEQIFLRAAAAAILNAYYPDPDLAYPIAAKDIIPYVNAVLATDDPATIVAAANILDEYNNLGCPLSNN